MKPYFLSFVSIFVVMDVIGTLPIFLSMTEGTTARQRRTVSAQAVAAGAAAAVGFIFAGQWLFAVLGITIYDFRVAGGLLLLVFAVHDLLFAHAARREASPSLGVVPIGIPLLVGPAVLTGLLLSVDTYGLTPTLAALGANLVIAFVVFSFGHWLIRLIGEAGAKGIGKIASLLLAAIAVMMIRSGIEAMVRGGRG
ncbi:MAG: MarC family protein [Deltaproteobacteria bacterium]|nr:MarC family protein [Deltaproteobacteria bacterium]